MPWDDPALNQAASDFFRSFARMEYALKAAGFLVKGTAKASAKQKAKANWKDFADAVQPAASSMPANVRAAIDFILNSPPKKQVVVNGGLEWDATPPQAQHEMELALGFICRVRNNLFHGGKFNGRWFEPERSGELMRSSLIVLTWCRDVCVDVRQAYES